MKQIKPSEIFPHGVPSDSMLSKQKEVLTQMKIFVRETSSTTDNVKIFLKDKLSALLNSGVSGIVK
jgi:hypothetical protein